MLKRLKNLLGIEGVKLQVEISDLSPGYAKGVLVLFAPAPFEIQALNYKVEEEYIRGRFNSKKKDTYLLKQWDEEVDISVDSDTPTEYPIEIDYLEIKSPIDQWSSGHPAKKAIGSVAKLVAGVDSKIYLTVSAKVKGTALHPYDRVLISD